MNISPIQPSSIQPIGPIEIGGAAPASGRQRIQQYPARRDRPGGSASNNANQSVQNFLSGDGEDLHSTVLAVQRADLEFDMLMQVRNKVVSAYQEVMRMQM